MTMYIVQQTSRQLFFSYPRQIQIKRWKIFKNKQTIKRFLIESSAKILFTFLVSHQANGKYGTANMQHSYLTLNLQVFLNGITHLLFLELPIISLVSQQCRAWSDCMKVQAGLALYWWHKA